MNARARQHEAGVEWVRLSDAHRIGGGLCGRCAAMAVEDILLRDGGTVRCCTICEWRPQAPPLIEED